jgi:hypothetical protein
MTHEERVVIAAEVVKHRDALNLALIAANKAGLLCEGGVTGDERLPARLFVRITVWEPLP